MAKPLHGINFRYPLAVLASITSVLGDPRSYGGHEGYDFAAPPGTPVLAAASGTVRRVGYMPDGYGYYVEVEHTGGVKTLYGHLLSLPALARGAAVQAGQLIGAVGASGYATGPHLHFHIQDANGTYLDVGQYVDMVVSSARSILADLSGPALDFLQQRDPCAEHIWRDKDLSAWRACREQAGSPPSAEEIVAAEFWSGKAWDEIKVYQEALEGRNSPSPFSPGGFGLDVLSDLEQKIEDLLLDIFFAPARLTINVFDLAETELKTGRETLEWLEERENVTLLASVTLITFLAFLFILIAVRNFLMSSPGLETAVHLVESPASTALEMSKST